MRDAASLQARRQRWSGLVPEVIANFVADDLDENDRDHNALWQALQTTNRLLLGVLVSTTTACILLAINIAIGSL